MSRLPRELVCVYLAAPLLMQPIVNPDFFGESADSLAREIAVNYLPATAILLALLLVHRLAALLPARGDVARITLHALLAGLAAAVASLLVHPLHLHITGDLPLPVYLQRNVGFTWLIVLPALLLDLHRGRARLASLELAEQRQHALRAQLEALRARTHPHFVFNALNTIASLIRDDADLAERTVHSLADILRYTLESTRRDSVPLARELEVVKAYLEVQSARFGARLRCQWSIAPGTEQLQVPPLCLQPLVENSVLHAVASRTRGGTLWISADIENGGLTLRVDDDGPGPGASNHRGSGTALVELTRRLELLHGEGAQVITRTSERGGFAALLRLPATAEAT